MGKRKRRLLSPKYARKFAHLRKAVLGATADGVVTKEEAKKIIAAVEEVVEEVKPAPVAEPAPVAKPVVDPAPVVKPKPAAKARRAPKAAAKPTAKKATAKTRAKKSSSEG